MLWGFIYGKTDMLYEKSSNSDVVVLKKCFELKNVDFQHFFISYSNYHLSLDNLFCSLSY